MRRRGPAALACAGMVVAALAAAAESHLPLPVASDRVWRPAPGTTWQWQLTTPIDTSVEADVFNIDLFDNSAALVAALKARGRRVVCYISAGSWEDWRPDAARFPRRVLGRRYAAWPRERWLDIRRIDDLAPVMRARLDLCRSKGFDAVELDNVDGYTNDTGFPLKAADQLRYNAWLANEARSRGLSVGLKNDPDQARALEPYFDWALTESCLAEGWCGAFRPFLDAGKAVFAAEYTDTKVDFPAACREAEKLGVSAILKKRALDAFRRTCR